LVPERTSRQDIDSERLIGVDPGGGDQLLGRTLSDFEFLAAILSDLDAWAVFAASLGDRERPKELSMKPPAGTQTARPMEPLFYKEF
jgi:hypothetical protein